LCYYIREVHSARSSRLPAFIAVSSQSPSARDRFIAFRRAHTPSPRLRRQSVTARGLEFAVWTSAEVPGAAAPLLCVNGGLLFDHTLLWPSLSPLAAKRQLIFYDQRGRGASQVPPGARAARIEHDAGDIPALRKALGYGKWDVLGHSWGGGIAMLGVEQDQDATRKLVLVDAVAPESSWMAGMAAAALPRLTVGERAILSHFTEEQLRADDPDVQSAYARAIYPAWFADHDLGRMFTPPRSTSVAGAAVLARLRREGYDWRNLLRALRVPTLVIHGERDLLPVEVPASIGQTLQNARLEIIPGAGHMPFWEAPDRFFEAVDAFLS
jgi:proline iminopeptidase